MTHLASWVKGQVLERSDLRSGPAMSGGPGHGQHVVCEVVAKSKAFGGGLWLQLLSQLYFKLITLEII